MPKRGPRPLRPLEWWTAHADELGTMTTDAFAAKHQLPRTMVSNYREKLHVPSPERFAWSTVDWSMPDADIARALGCSREAVRQARERRKDR